MIAFQTGIEYIVNTALGSTAIHRFYFSGFGSENSGTAELTFGKPTGQSGGFIDSAYHPMIYSNGYVRGSDGALLKGRNCSCSRISQGFYRITLAYARTDVLYSVVATTEIGNYVAACTNKQLSTFDILTTSGVNSVLYDANFCFMLSDFE